MRSTDQAPAITGQAIRHCNGSRYRCGAIGAEPGGRTQYLDAHTSPASQKGTIGRQLPRSAPGGASGGGGAWYVGGATC